MSKLSKKVEDIEESFEDAKNKVTSRNYYQPLIAGAIIALVVIGIILVII